MREQAQRLVAAIAVFRIDDRAVAPAFPAPVSTPAVTAPTPASAVAHPPYPKLATKTPVQPRAAGSRGATKAQPAKKAPEGDDWEEF
jgi:hypothetical protein